MKLFFLFCFPVFLGLFPFLQTDSAHVPAEPETVAKPMDSLRIPVKIISIEDGDTAYALYNSELQLALRLAHIDAPEKRGKQPYWQQSKQKLSDLCFGQTITITSKRNSKGNFETDQNGRMIAVLYNNRGQNVNYQMVKSGLAWHYKKYSQDSRYDVAEKNAKAAKAGLWSSNSPMSPDDFRNKR